MMSPDGPQETPAGQAPPAAENRNDLERRLAFLQLAPDDARTLQSLRKFCGQYMEEFVQAFYRHLFSFEETARFLRDPELVRRLKKAQQAHFESMLDANWNEEYVVRHRRIGDAHAAVGIEPAYFLGAYNQYIQFSLRAFGENEGVSGQFAGRIGALLKAVLLDIGLTLDAYFDQATQAMRTALEMLLQANTELRQFAQFTSHDLKTPLATVINLCDESLDEFGEAMPDEARRLIEAARNQTFRMSAMIDELLSATISMPAEKDLQEASSERAVMEAVDRVRPALEKKQIELTLPEHFPWVAGDRIRLREAFYNLLSNAAKFIEKRPGRISIAIENRGGECLFSIADNGPGIPPDELGRIFAPFRRLPMHREHPGSGLGLYFTKNLIEQQGGRVWAESEPGKGSRFIIALKRAGA
jgi:signal transduction histidine kinase